MRNSTGWISERKLIKNRAQRNLGFIVFSVYKAFDLHWTSADKGEVSRHGTSFSSDQWNTKKKASPVRCNFCRGIIPIDFCYKNIKNILHRIERSVYKYMQQNKVCGLWFNHLYLLFHSSKFFKYPLYLMLQC